MLNLKEILGMLPLAMELECVNVVVANQVSFSNSVPLTVFISTAIYLFTLCHTKDLLYDDSIYCVRKW